MTESEELYFEYLCEIVSTNRISKSMTNEHEILLKTLYSVEFIPRVKNDDNRVVDGLQLRDRFCYGEDICPWKEFFNRPCSFLEMLVALSIRLEDDIMHYPNRSDKTSFWFWEMLRNCDLDLMDDVNIENKRFCKDDIIDICNRINDRKYDANGDGGLFPLAFPKKDARKMELWYQMNEWVQENYCPNDDFL